VAPPVFTPSGGAFSKSIQLELTTATPTAKIFYTTDGSAPSASSFEYDAARYVVLTKSVTVQAIAILKSGESKVVSATFEQL